MGHSNQFLLPWNQKMVPPWDDLKISRSDSVNIIANSLITIQSLTNQFWISLNNNHGSSRSELKASVSQMYNNKAPRMDGITAEILKNGSEKMIDLLEQVIQSEVPQDWRGTLLVYLYKKGSMLDCSNFRGISLLSIVGKLFSRIILNSTRITVRFLCKLLHCRYDFKCSAITAQVQRTESSIVPMFHWLIKGFWYC